MLVAEPLELDKEPGGHLGVIDFSDSAHQIRALALNLSNPRVERGDVGFGPISA